MLRILIPLTMAGCLCGQAPDRRAGAAQPSEPGSVRGVVVGPSDEPIRKAEVTLRSLGGRPSGMFAGRPGVPGTAGSVWSHTTDASGTFRFENLPAGNYSITVQRNGYVRSDSRPGARTATSTITVSSGQAVTGISVRLIPHGVIAGKVTDEDGDPVAFVSVQVLRERWIAGRRQYTPMNAGSTNDLGEYRIAGLLPGRYFLVANHNRQQPGRTQPRSPGAVADQSYSSQFYPGAADISQASVVEVAAGQELRGIDFGMRKTATFRIRGKVLDESGKPAQGVSVMAAPAEGYFLGMRGMGVARNADGSFEVAGVQPGSYTLVANRGGREGTRSVARTPVQVGTRDLDGVIMQLQPTFAISGTVRAPEGVAVGNARIVLESLEPGVPFGAIGTSGPLDAGGAWTATNVSPGRYRFSLTPMPQGAYIKAVTVQGQDITAGALVSAPATGVEIQLAAKAPTVAGTVLGPENEAVAGATVVLVPDTGRRDQYWLFRQTVADSNGSFNFPGVNPGLYSVFAFRDVEDGSWFSPDFLRPLEGKGTPVKLAEGSAESVQVSAQ
jgi:hypothetical protein